MRTKQVWSRFGLSALHEKESSLMNVHFPTRLRMAVGTVCGVALAAGLAILARADEWNKRTILTVNQPIQVSDKLLEPGQYVFKLLDSNSDRHIVQIFNGDQTQLVDIIMAIPNYRLRPTGDSRFAFWETPPRNARALRAWFYPGDNFGQEFPYPKHPAVLEASTAVTHVEPQPAPPAAEPAQPAPETQQAAPKTTLEQPPPAPQPQPEVAQNHPPAPPSAEPAPTEQPNQPPETPSELPHTASPYPWIGLAGFAALGLSGLLRLKRFE
jgi:LPXTG-motif cell wall-anchored protein